MSTQKAARGSRKRVRFYVGLVDDKILFFKDWDYNVLRADLFSSQQAARKCYEKVACVRVELLDRKARPCK